VILQKTSIEGLLFAESTVRKDGRGSFSRLFCHQELQAIIGDRSIVQINYSLSETLGVVRGLHFQRPPFMEVKMVRCLRGKVWDVAVDLRKDSPTFLRWHAEVLTPTNARMMIIPEGFAHGFQALCAGSEILYLHTAPYTPSSEGALRYDDPNLKIDWPIPVTNTSHRDASHPYIDESFCGIVF
jgi:dTDP-4-dehydrorhamnose 3,5-epimerase